MASSRGSSGPVVAGYFQSWAVYRNFSYENINPTLCTHLIYAFAGLDESTNEIKSLNPDLDITQGGYRNILNLKQRNPRLKVTLAVGGWEEGSAKYSRMASSSSARNAFVQSVVNFLRQHQFDGLDLDWEYPAQRGGMSEDRNNFVTLCQELRRAFNPHGWLLTAAFAADGGKANISYDLPALSRVLDYIYLMAYDYNTHWNGHTGHNTPICDVKNSVQYYLNQGVPASKLVLGLAMYGRTFGLDNSSNCSVGAPAHGEALEGPLSKEKGFLGYNEIVQKLSSEPSLWRKAWDEGQKVPYMYSGHNWVSYDDVRSIKKKAQFAKSQNLAGVMAWAIDMDDFHGCGENGMHPLLRAINEVL